MKVINGLKKKSEKIITKSMVALMKPEEIKKLYFNLIKRNNLTPNLKEIKSMVVSRYNKIQSKEIKKNEKKRKVSRVH